MCDEQSLMFILFSKMFEQTIWQEDVGIMKDIGFDAYRFSISWSRILPGEDLLGIFNFIFIFILNVVASSFGFT